MDLFRKMNYTRERRSRLHPELQIKFLRRLYHLLVNGYPMGYALNIISWDRSLNRCANHIIHALKIGQHLDEALKTIHFHETIVAHLYFARHSGQLTTHLKQCIDVVSSRFQQQKKFKRLMRYPLLLLSIFTLLIIMMYQYVLPSYINLFHHSEAASAVLKLLHFLQYIGYFMVVIILMIAFILLLWRQIKDKLNISTYLKIIAKIPIYRTFLKRQTTFYFTIHFCALLKTGMPYQQIFNHLTSQKKLRIIAYYASNIQRDLKNGLPMTHSFPTFQFLDHHLQNIFQHQLNSKTIINDLTIYAEMLLEEIQHQTERLLSWIQPVFLMVIAIFVILMYVTIMFPMYQFMNEI